MKAFSITQAVSTVLRDVFGGSLPSDLARPQSMLVENLEARLNFGYGWNNGPQTPNPTPPYPPCTTCPCPPSPLPSGGGPGMPGGGSPGGGPGPGPRPGPRPGPGPTSAPAGTVFPINYFTGTPQYTSADITSDAFGVPWGHVRSWTGLNEGGVNGNGWMTSDLPYLVVKMNQYYFGHGGIVSVVQGGGSGYEFTIDIDDTKYKPRYSSNENLTYIPGYQSGATYVPGTFQFKDSSGNTTTFYDVPRDTTSGYNSTIYDADNNATYGRMSQNGGGYAQGVTQQWFDPATGAESDVATPYRFGAFKSWTDASGKVTANANYDSSGNLTNVVRTDGSGLYERFHYDNNTSFTNNLGGSATILTKVTLQRSTNLAGPWTDIRSADYTYYTGSSTAADKDYGRFGDLKMVVIKDYQRNPSGDVVDQKYYRYDKFGSSSYYNGDSVNGPTNRISTTGGPADWDGTSTPTNSYFKSGDSAVMTGLKSVFEGTHFARLTANLGGVSSFEGSSDSAVNPYASNVFNYQRIDPGSSEYPASYGNNTIYRATSEIVAGEGCSTCSGGFGTYTLDYHVGRQWNTYNYGSGWTNNFDTNTWYIRTTETMPDQTSSTADNDQNIAYTNEIGAPILMVNIDRNGTDSTTDDKEYLTYYRYDAQGRLILVAHPSVFQQSGGTWYNEGYADLINWSSSSEYAQQNAGLIDVYTFGATTTATATSAGDAAGYLKSVGVQKGYAGSAVPILAQAYFAHSYGGNTVYPVAATTDYRDVDGNGSDDAITTTVAYTWALDGSSSETNRIATRTVSYPAVNASRNGSGTATTEVTVFDSIGRPIWMKDASGFITYTQYDTATGAVSKRIVDVDTTKTSDFSNLPSGWTTPSGGGLHLITTGQFEALGRPVKVTDPNGDVTYTAYNDSNHETRTYHSAAGSFAQVGPVFIHRMYWPAQSAAAGQRQVFTEDVTSNVTPSLTSGVPNGTETVASSNIQELRRSLTNDAGQTIEKDTYTGLSGVTYSALAATLGTVGVNYLATLYAYDDRGRRKRVETPDGTITRTLYDARGLVVGVWKGTDDTATTGYWSPSNQGGTNLVKIASSTYDADQNLTTSNRVLTHNASTGADSTFYQTNYGYDYRDRLTDVRGSDKVATKYTLDNSGNRIVTETYADANANFVMEDAERRGKQTASYDDRDQMYRSATFQFAPSTDPAPGTPGDSLATNYWYDPRGNEVKTRQANGLQSKSLFDGANRQIATYITTDATESNYTDALSASNDHVIEQTATYYDKGGRDILDASFKRKNDSPATGLLNSENSWSQSSVNWYDAADRIIETANYGSEFRADYDGPGNLISPAPTRVVFNRSTGAIIDADTDGIPDIAENTPPAPPTSANETNYGYIVSQYGYDAGGRLYRITDNKSRITQTNFDLAGRKTAVIENYTDGTVAATDTDKDRTTSYLYDNDGRLAQIVAINANGTATSTQTTSFLYTSPIDQSWVTKTVYPDSTATTAATAKTVSALSQASGVATATSTAHGYVVGDVVQISGATNDARLQRLGNRSKCDHQ